MHSGGVREIKASANRLAWRSGSCTRGFLSAIRLFNDGEIFIDGDLALPQFFISQPMLI